jgi:hypothetical protein
MRSLYTAIIHLREPTIMRVRQEVEPRLRVVRGVDEVHFEPSESLLTVLFDHDQTELADLVRLIEDQDTAVSSVAQRRMMPERFGVNC